MYSNRFVPHSSLINLLLSEVGYLLPLFNLVGHRLTLLQDIDPLLIIQDVACMLEHI